MPVFKLPLSGDVVQSIYPPTGELGRHREGAP